MTNTIQQEVFRDVQNKFLNNKVLKFFGILLYRFPKKLLTQTQYEELSSSYGFPFKAATDFENIYIYPESHEDIADICTSLVHELLHNLGSHDKRRGNRDINLWNVVTDHCIAEIIQSFSTKTKFLKVYPNDIFFPDIARDFPNIKAEKLYDMFKKKTEKKQVGEDSEITQDSYELDYKNDKCKVVNDKVSVGGKDFIKIKEHMQKKDLQVEKQKEKLKADASILWNSNLIDKGSLPESVVNSFNDLLQLQVDYREVLQDALITSLTPTESRSWKKLNPLFTQTNLPCSEGFDKVVNDILFVIDVSSSCTYEDVKTAVSFCHDAFKSSQVENFEIITHHYLIEEKFTLTKGDDLAFNAVMNMKIGGGTSHQDVFNYIKNQILSGHDYSIVIFLTDYESDVEQCINNFPEIHHLPFVWILSSSARPNLPMLQSRALYIENMVEK